jgi:putative DNA primase/helicase
LGDYALQADFRTFLERRSDGPRNDLARLAGARFVAAAEAGEGKRLDESLIKLVTGGDTIVGRFLYQEHFEFPAQFKLLLAANHKPTIRGTDEAIWRRIHLIPFLVTIPEGDRDKDLVSKLRAEAPGILRWAVEGCLSWQERGLDAPPEVRQATSEYRAESDPLGGFFEECCRVEPNARVGATPLYEGYTRWAESMGEKAMTQKAFGTRLRERGFNRVRGYKGRYVWHGLTTDTDDSEPLNDREPFFGNPPISLSHEGRLP